MPYGYIYKIINTKNNKIYIGQTTKTIFERLNKHIQEAKCEANGTRQPNYFHSAILKYGEEAFVIEEIDTAEDASELNKKEIYWIDYYQTTDKSIGYNLMTGGKSGLKSDETKVKIGEKKKENWQTEELAKRMRAGLEKATQTWIQICKDNRIECICENCNKVLLLPPWEAKKRKYCSQECANQINIKRATEKAAIINTERRLNRDKSFREAIQQWASNSRDLILTCPENKISTTLMEIQNIAKIQFGFSDWRCISIAICGHSSKKEMLKCLKQMVL